MLAAVQERREVFDSALRSAAAGVATRAAFTLQARLSRLALAAASASLLACTALALPLVLSPACLTQQLWCDVPPAPTRHGAGGRSR